MKLTYKNIEFEVKIKNSNVSKKWEELTKNNPISKVSAYGYGEINKVVDKLNETIKGLKKYNLPEIENVDNQQLDYLHDKFLEFHDNSKGEERKLFSDLNEYIHKAESLLVGSYPSIVIQMENNKHEFFEDTDYEDFTFMNKVGEVYLNYSLLGKTLATLSKSDDPNIHTFTPFDRFNSDIVIYFHDNTQNAVDFRESLMMKYYEKHREYFEELGYVDWDDPRLKIGSYKIGDIVGTKKQVLELGNKLSKE